MLRTPGEMATSDGGAPVVCVYRQVEPYFSQFRHVGLRSSHCLARCQCICSIIRESLQNAPSRASIYKVRSLFEISYVVCEFSQCSCHLMAFWRFILCRASKMKAHWRRCMVSTGGLHRAKAGHCLPKRLAGISATGLTACIAKCLRPIYQHQANVRLSCAMVYSMVGNFSV